MGSRAAEAAVVDKERCSQAQERLDRQERYLPTRRDRRPSSELAKFLPRLAGGQVQEIGKLSHVVRLLLCELSGAQLAHCTASCAIPL